MTRRLAERHESALPEPGPSNRRELLTAVAVGLGAAVVMGLRAPIAMRQLWAEDGSVFLQAAIDNGPLQPFATSYAGYFHFVPRVIGGVTSLVPLRAAAFTTWLAVALVVGWCAATVCHLGPPWVRSLPSRIILALGFVLIPAMNDESIANAANLQFVLLFTSLVVLIGAPRGRTARISGCALVLVTGLTTPLAAALLPFAVLRLVRRKPIRIDPEAAAWAIGVGVQLLAIAVTGTERTTSNTLPAGTIATQFAERVVFVTFSGLDRGARLLSMPLTLLLVALVAVAAVVAWRHGHRQRALVIVAVPLVGATVYAFAGRRLALAGDLPPRYELFPAWCMLWAALTSTETLITARRGASAARDLVVVGAFAAAVLTFAWLAHWQPDPYRIEGPTWLESIAAATRTCRDGQLTTADVTIMPVIDAGPGWFVRVPCESL